MGSWGGPWRAPWGPKRGPWVSWGVAGCSREGFGRPRGDPDDRDTRSGGSQGGSRSIEKCPESVFCEIPRAPSAPFCSFKHVHFSALTSALGSDGGSGCGLWGPLGGPGAALGALGGVPRGHYPPPGGSRGVPSERVPPPGGSRRPPEIANQRFGGVVVLP